MLFNTSLNNSCQSPSKPSKVKNFPSKCASLNLMLFMLCVISHRKFPHLKRTFSRLRLQCTLYHMMSLYTSHDVPSWQQPPGSWAAQSIHQVGGCPVAFSNWTSKLLKGLWNRGNACGTVSQWKMRLTEICSTFLTPQSEVLHHESCILS